jgi:hypothetical protein
MSDILWVQNPGNEFGPKMAFLDTLLLNPDALCRLRWHGFSVLPAVDRGETYSQRVRKLFPGQAQLPADVLYQIREVLGVSVHLFSTSTARGVVVPGEFLLIEGIWQNIACVMCSARQNMKTVTDDQAAEKRSRAS